MDLSKQFYSREDFDLKKEKEQLQKKLNEAIIGQRNLQNELNTFKARNSDKMKENPYKVSGYDDEENMWELLGNIIN